jgi:hypothetical protein
MEASFLADQQRVWVCGCVGVGRSFPFSVFSFSAFSVCGNPRDGPSVPFHYFAFPGMLLACWSATTLGSRLREAGSGL